MDFRKEAEARALRAEKNLQQIHERRNSYRLQLQQQNLRRQSIRDELQVNEIDFSSETNETPRIAQLAEIDYKWNGSRARAQTGDFIIPRWVPDEEVMNCRSCNGEFDFVNRKHHCRHCGLIYCENCSPNKLLLPHEFGYRDPVRVCAGCYERLLPFQQVLSSNIANHQRINNVDVASTNCNVRRYMNMPFSSTLGSEIRKAAYSAHNLFMEGGQLLVQDRAIPLRLLAAARGLAFLTVVKGGFIFAPRLGTGLVVARLPADVEEDAAGTGAGTGTGTGGVRDRGGGGAPAAGVAVPGGQEGRRGEGGCGGGGGGGGGGGVGWSAPTAIGTFGLSWGAVIGLDVTDYVVILTTDEAVAAFSGHGQITIGAGIDVAVGPVGRSGSADLHLSVDSGQLAPAYSYSQSRGLFAGVSLDGTVILSRPEVNHRFYGRPVTPTELLSGASVPPPRAAAPLYDALADALSSLPAVHHHAIIRSRGKQNTAMPSSTNSMSSMNPTGSSGVESGQEELELSVFNSATHDGINNSNNGSSSNDNNAEVIHRIDEVLRGTEFESSSGKQAFVDVSLQDVSGDGSRRNNSNYNNSSNNNNFYDSNNNNNNNNNNNCSSSSSSRSNQDPFPQPNYAGIDEKGRVMLFDKQQQQGASATDMYEEVGVMKNNATMLL